MARTPRGAATVLLLSQTFLLGAGLVGTGLVVGTAPQAQAATVAKGWTPYGHGGMLVPLPGGGHIRLVMPSGKPSPSDPPADPTDPPPSSASAPTSAPTPDSPAPDPAAPSPAASVPAPAPAPSQSASASPGASAGAGGTPSAGPSVAVPDLPIPVFDPIYPVPADPSGAVAAPVTGPASTAAAPPRTAPPAQAGQQDWLPLGDGPPPLGPQALAAPLTGPDATRVPSGSWTGSGAGPMGPQAARWEQKKRLLPLGVGLALIGSGAGLFGWRLRRP